MHRVTALDGLRTIAVLAVILQHYGPKALANAVNPGGLGVRLFFVLSGFLITGILLNARRTGADEDRGGILRAFYLRRAIRILPAFYLVLALGVALEPQIRRDWLWHATYLSNHYVIALGHWPRAISHAWSLAVEEQFYVVWPLAVLFTPVRRLGPMIMATIAAGPLSRGLIFAFTGSALFASLPMTSALDSLGVGAWLAWQRRDPDRRSAPVPSWLAALGVILVATSRVVPLPEWVSVVTGDLAAAAAFVWVIDRVSRGGSAVSWLTWRPLTYVGTISYGVYLVHNFAGSLGVALLPKAAARWVESHGWMPALVVTLVSVLLASASWRFVEEPLNRLKRRWPYLPSTHLPTTSQAAGL